MGEFSRNIDSEGLTPIGRSLLKTAGWLVSLGPKILLNNGDYTTTPGLLDAPTLLLLSKLEDEWKNLPNKILNLGNHDLDNKVGLHNLALHSKLSGYVLPEYNKVLQVGDLYVVPFTYTLEDQIQLLRSIPDGAVVAVHTPIEGAFLRGSSSDEHGVPLQEFRRFALTLASHYHTPQVFDSKGRVLIYEATEFVAEPGTVLILGTPIPHSFADIHPVYGAWVIDTQTKIVSFHINPHAPLYINIVANTPADLDFSTQSNCRPVYVSATLPDQYHKEILQAGIPGATTFRLKRPPVEAPRRENVLTPSPGGGSGSEYLIASLLSYLDSLGQPYPRTLVEKVVSKELGELPPHPGILGGRVRFLQMAIENFLSWEKETIDFSNPGLWLVSGINRDTSTASSNGSGKTSLLEALVWGLYGTVLRDSPAKDAVVRVGAKVCKVAVDFEVNNTTYRVVRTRSSSKSSVALYLKGEEGWQDIAEGNTNEATKRVITTLGIPLDDFLLTSYFGSHLTGKFTDLKDTEKKQFLGRVYELEVYDRLLERFRERSTQARASQSALEENLKVEESRFLETQKLYEHRQAQVEKEIEDRLATIHTSTVLLQEDTEKRDVLQKQVEEKRRAFYTRREQVIRRDAAQKYCKDKASELQKVEALVSTPPTQCDRCGQSLPQIAQEEYSKKMVERYLVVQKDLEVATLALTSVEADLNLLPEVTQSELQAFEHSLTLLLNSVSTLTEKIRLLKSLPDPKEKLHEVEALLTSIQTNICSLKERIAGQQTDLDLFRLLVNALGPSGVVSYILDRSVEQINSYLGYVSESLFGGDYSVWLTSTKELKDGRDANIITLQYSTPGGHFGLSSDGEKRKAEIALFLAVNYLLTAQGRGSTNLVIADEALDSLDPRAASSTVDALHRFVSEEGKVGFLISHSEGVQTLVDQQIVIERQNGVSRILKWTGMKT